jgi:uncharacterized protein (TIGR02594 family)
MTQAARIADALRPIAPGGKLLAGDVPLINELAALWEKRLPASPATPATPAPPAGGEPSWITAGRKLIGTREIPGPQNNSWIAKGWARLGAPWFNDDETPWCGYFVANCLDAVGLPYPSKGEFARALRWQTWGDPIAPRLGAIGVKVRKGGGHVFFLVGETPDRRFFKALGGNQGNCVSIVDIDKADVKAIRWPVGAAPVSLPLPILPAGTVSRSEA